MTKPACQGTGCLILRPQPAERPRWGWTHIVAEDGPASVQSIDLATPKIGAGSACRKPFYASFRCLRLDVHWRERLAMAGRIWM
jgi:hypothetical protein